MILLTIVSYQNPSTCNQITEHKPVGPTVEVQVETFPCCWLVNVVNNVSGNADNTTSAKKIETHPCIF